MYIDFNQLIKNELYAIERICKAIESSIQREEQKVIGGEQLKGNESLYMSRSSIGIVYYKRVNLQGKRVSKKIGGPDNMEVIKVKQKRYEDDMPEFKGETIKLSDIKEGDIVSITFDENGKTLSIKVMGGAGEQPSNNGSSV